MVSVDGFERLQKKLDEIQEFMDEYLDKLETMCYAGDEVFLEFVKELKEADAGKLSKKQRKAMALRIVKEKCPKLVALFDNLELINTGIGALIEEKKDKLQEIMDGLDEISNLQDEIDQRKDELNL